MEKTFLVLENEEKIEAEIKKRMAERDTAEINEYNQTAIRPAMKKKLDLVKKATKLVRCVVTNRNPMKAKWEGEVIAVGNDIGVNEKKYVPFSLESGYHLPQIIVNALNDKKCTIFVNKKGADGKTIQVGKLIKEYAIETLDPLTQKEYDELGASQRARGAIEED